MIVVYMYSMQLNVLATAVGVGVSTSIRMRHIPTTKKKKRRSWELHGPFMHKCIICFSQINRDHDAVRRVRGADATRRARGGAASTNDPTTARSAKSVGEMGWNTMGA